MDKEGHSSRGRGDFYRSSSPGSSSRYRDPDPNSAGGNGRHRGHEPNWRDRGQGQEARAEFRTYTDRSDPHRKHSDSTGSCRDRETFREPERSGRDSGAGHHRGDNGNSKYSDQGKRRDTSRTSDMDFGRDYRGSDSYRHQGSSHRGGERSYRDSERGERSHRDYGGSSRDPERRYGDDRHSTRGTERSYPPAQRSPPPQRNERLNEMGFRDTNRNDLEEGRSYAFQNRRSSRDEPNKRQIMERSASTRGSNSDLRREEHTPRSYVEIEFQEVELRPRDPLGGGIERRLSSASAAASRPREAIKRPRSVTPSPDVELSKSMALMGTRRHEDDSRHERFTIQDVEIPVKRVGLAPGFAQTVNYEGVVGSSSDVIKIGGLNGSGVLARTASGRGGAAAGGSGSGDAPVGRSYPSEEGGRTGARRGVRLQRSDRYDNVRSRPDGLSSKAGTSGEVVNLIANFFPLRMKPSWCLFNYRVDFKPEEERTAIKKGLLRVHNSSLGGYIFDGANMYTANRLHPEPLVLYSERQQDHVKMELTLRLVGQVSPGDVQYLQFYNIIVRSCLQILEFEELGRHFYDRKAAIHMPHHRLELWPGYITTLRNYEQNLMLCVEVTHKVLRLDSCLSIINHLSDRNVKKFQQSVCDELIGSIVMTHYNRKTYRVDDIDWNKNPSSRFDQRGTSVSLADYYYTKYQIRIQDMKQPLLVSRPKKRECHRGDEKPLLLIPELCQMTGLSEEIRKNYKTMRELSTYLQQPPDRRVQNIQNFMTRLCGSAEIRGLLTNWGLEFEKKLVSVQGRIAPPEQVIFRLGIHKESVPVGQGADWNFAFKSKSMYSSMKLLKWVVLVTQRDSRNVDTLLHTMRTVGTGLDFHVPQPVELLRLPDNKAQTYVNGVNQVVANNKYLDMIFIILPGPQHDLYSAVKKRCCIDYGIASQCFLSKHIQPNAKGLMSIVTKVVVQMNAKMGGEPWATNNPLKASQTMIVGFDVYHCGKRRGSSVGAMVCTTNKELSKYFSTVSFHSGRDELSDKLCSDITKCVFAFRSKNEDKLPDRIIMYRDGVGEGQLTYVYNTELEQIRIALKSLYTSSGREAPKFTLIIVTKKGNARIFHPQHNGRMKNPDAGTIVDNIITLPERYDFFLISQSSKQGTVSPTSYNVIWDEQGLDPDKIQRLTFKLCHLYYNWSGTVAVPAVCQYAHKLAYLTGLSLGSPSHESLSHYLYFL